MLQPNDTPNSVALVPASPPIDRVILPEHYAAELDASGRRNVKSALKRYAEWLASSGRNWTGADFSQYRAYLETEYNLQGQTINNHLALIRGRYDAILTDPAALAVIDDMARQYCEREGWTPNPANITAAADRVTRNIKLSISSKHNAQVVKKQDRADSEFIRMTEAQANKFLKAPDRATLKGLRDAALIALLLSTGLREAELCDLTVDDLRQHMNGELACRVREGKGKKQRLIPYGELDGCLTIVDRWLAVAGITTGAVFRGLYRGGAKLRPVSERTGRGLSVRQVENILAEYPITIAGELRTIKPHDCRRSYARLCYDNGMEPVAIQQNLGHADLKTTLLYIGVLDGTKRRPPSFLKFNVGNLPPAPMV